MEIIDNTTFVLLLGLFLGLLIGVLTCILYHRLFARFFGRGEIRQLQNDLKSLEKRISEKDKLITKYIKEAKKRLHPDIVKELQDKGE